MHENGVMGRIAWITNYPISLISPSASLLRGGQSGGGANVEVAGFVVSMAVCPKDGGVPAPLDGGTCMGTGSYCLLSEPSSASRRMMGMDEGALTAQTGCAKIIRFPVSEAT